MKPDSAFPCQHVDDKKKTNHAQIGTQVFVHPDFSPIFNRDPIFFSNINPLQKKQQPPTKGRPMKPDPAFPCKHVDKKKKTNYTHIDQ